MRRIYDAIYRFQDRADEAARGIGQRLGQPDLRLARLGVLVFVLTFAGGLAVLALLVAAVRGGITQFAPLVVLLAVAAFAVWCGTHPRRR